MRNPLKTAFAVMALAAGLAAAPALYAQDQQAPGSMTGQEGMMGEGGMMPMMDMMQQMSRMMTNCNKMMESMMDESGDRPNQQFRNGDSPAPEQRD